MHHPLTIDVRPDRDRVLIHLAGELDHFSALEVRAVVRDLSGSGWTTMVLDLSHLDFMDAGGVHVLEELQDGPLRCSMVDGHPAVSLPLELLGLRRVLPTAEVGR